MTKIMSQEHLDQLERIKNGTMTREEHHALNSHNYPGMIKPKTEAEINASWERLNQEWREKGLNVSTADIGPNGGPSQTAHWDIPNDGIDGFNPLANYQQIRTMPLMPRGMCGTGAVNFQNEFSASLRNMGVAMLHNDVNGRKPKSKTAEFINGNGLSEEDKLPIRPGNAYGTFLFKHHQGGMKAKEVAMNNKAKGNVFTDHMDALKTAIQAMGIRSDRNPGGMPIDFRDARKIWFGDKDDVDPVEEQNWKISVQLGDNKIDPKRVRKFVNEDGSLTWEILNEDKTVMSRFTMGNYKGTSVFSQGGWKSFAELLKKAKAELGADPGADFDAIRSMF